MGTLPVFLSPDGQGAHPTSTRCSSHTWTSRDSTDSLTLMQLRGKLVILLIFVAATAMSGYAWWHQLQAGRRSAAFWGSDAAVLVRYAPEVEFISLRPKSEDPESSPFTLMIDNLEYVLGQPLNITSSRGMVHVRHALIDDLSFDWDSTADDTGQWEFLLRFRDGQRQATAAVDTKTGHIYFLDGLRVARFIPKIATAFQQKRDEWQKLARSP
jgi:hypothetical protein